MLSLTWLVFVYVLSYINFVSRVSLSCVNPCFVLLQWFLSSLCHCLASVLPTCRLEWDSLLYCLVTCSPLTTTKFIATAVAVRLCSKQLGRFASLSHNIYIASNPTPVNADHAANAGGPTIIILI